MNSANSAKQKPDIWDAVVVGTGPAGCSTAIELAKQGWRVLMLDKHNTMPHRYGESLPPHSVNLVCQLLGDLNSDNFAQHGLSQTQGNQSCWLSDQVDISDFYFTTKGHGLAVNRQQFDKALFDRASALGVFTQLNCKFVDCQQKEENGNWQINVQDLKNQPDKNIVSRYLVDASGRAAVVAKALDINTLTTDRLIAFACYFQPKANDSNSGKENALIDDGLYTHIEACEHGWWYSNLLPSSNNEPATRVVVFHTDRDLDIAKQATNEEGFNKLLMQTQHIRALLQKHQYQNIGKVRAVSASSQSLCQYRQGNFVAVGDTAQAYDPLSSQGISKAMQSGVMAGQLISYALEDGATEQATNGYLSRYANDQTQLWQQYTEQHQYYYQIQPRWPEAPFWQRRRAQTQMPDHTPVQIETKIHTQSHLRNVP